MVGFGAFGAPGFSAQRSQALYKKHFGDLCLDGPIRVNRFADSCESPDSRESFQGYAGPGLPQGPFLGEQFIST